jgi:hypothetical protein
MTVVKAKSLRLKTIVEEKPQEIKTNEETIEKSPTSPIPQTKFTLPDNAQKINDIITIIETHKGDQEIIIGNKKILLNKEGIQKIQDLLIIK